MGDDPEKCNAIRNADEKPPAPVDDSKKGKEQEEVETEKESSESQKIARDVLIQPTPPKERDDSQKAISQAPRPKEEKHSKSKLGSLECIVTDILHVAYAVEWQCVIEYRVSIDPGHPVQGSCPGSILTRSTVPSAPMRSLNC
ncbi:unnamed protein product [Haemonchus placei]|uniref:Uncharacterized protein n=1 Tax=Haemonchus placei TaxID=6290 RepID=A0A0N4W1R8_HAEPC|nr:unnamed protein product [Haemonchus placei]